MVYTKHHLYFYFMKHIKLILSIIVVVIVLGGGIWWYLTNNKDAQRPQSASQESFPNTDKLPFVQQPPTQEDLNNGGVIANDNFSIDYPAGWASSTAPEGIDALIIKQDENITNQQALTAGFQSYIAVSPDSFAQKSQAQYVDLVKQQLSSLLPDATFTNEHAATINGRSAYEFEIKLNQNDINFHVLMVVIQGNNDDAWVISFNTLEEFWSGYAQTFADISNSFQVK